MNQLGDSSPEEANSTPLISHWFAIVFVKGWKVTCKIWPFALSCLLTLLLSRPCLGRYIVKVSCMRFLCHFLGETVWCFKYEWTLQAYIFECLVTRKRHCLRRIGLFGVHMAFWKMYVATSGFGISKSPPRPKSYSLFLSCRSGCSLSATYLVPCLPCKPSLTSY